MRCLESLVQNYCNHPQKLPQIHTLLITTGFFLSTPPSDSQPRCQGSTNTTFVYNCLIRAYLRRGDPPAAALRLFAHMLEHGTPPNHHTFPSLLKAAAAFSFFTGRAIHAQAIRRGLLLDDFVNCSIVRFYAKLGHLSEARNTFDEIPQPDLASCNAMLDALCLNGDLESASHLFECMIVKDVISWTSLINGFARNGNFRGAIELLRRLMHKNWQAETVTVRPNEATLVSVLFACANMDGAGALPGGTQIHGYVIRHETRMTAFLGTALIDMYGKHGRLSYCTNVFAAMDEKEVCTWNAMISALASNGNETVALGLLDRMRAEGLRPNHITFVAILTACARARLVDAGLRWFEAMNSEFGVAPLMEHYGCVVDLLSRAGLLNEAVEFIRRMPVEADASVWGALLGACKVHGDVQLGTQVGRRMITLQPWHSGVYTVLRNIYAGEGRWNEAEELRQAMENAGVKKIVGQSWIDSGCRVQNVSADISLLRYWRMFQKIV
ncbi:putative pentatricopeptide repeat-containing protein At1g10330 [Phoenix dactylifera]|uniref:Pentatricopeptide repeat-containing protein At1g10330 n=1 Tax=Phoenix dactylifera TaxID=42345 RepID=A0A8B7BNN9_PHODC|nr:putative pentatricopeptide repeat-containing protein At1g10330 [Phoenix dactylifera]